MSNEQNINNEGFVGRRLYDHGVTKLNRESIVVETADLRGEDNAHHKYTIDVIRFGQTGDTPDELVERCTLNFQNGGLAEVGPNGITEQALLAVVLDRLRSFNDGPYRCRENSMMITKIEEALMWSGKRAADRAMRGVEGRRVS